MKKILDVLIKWLTYLLVFTTGVAAGFVCAIVLLNVL